ncbi:unnamed protein product [Rangifer tarandus platyrhynchus]|uniref:Uncharacterized protein n=2 Tax=Rangifer tarandus platyrhynchus TaxID=3082113 RepID=A0AC59ZA66_RANTA|nr:unnamed protein product [Rangifer tarandus platyrhynchus]
MDMPLKQIWVRKRTSLETTSGPVHASSWDVSPAKPGSRSLNASCSWKLSLPHCRQLCAKPAIASSPAPAPGTGGGELGPVGQIKSQSVFVKFYWNLLFRHKLNTVSTCPAEGRVK